MNILFCGEKNVQNGLLITIISLTKHVKDLNIYILTINKKIENKTIAGIPERTIEILDNLVKKNNKENFVKLIDATDIFDRHLPTKNLKTRYTPCCMLRLYADLIKELPSKILYLDTDVICRKNPIEILDLDITNFEIAGVLDHYGKWFFKNNILKFDYLNSGILLLNLDKIRETGLFERCREICKNKRMAMPDQSALNKAAKYKKILPRKYNEQKKLHSDTIFQHFSTGFKLWPVLHTVTIKPWEIEKVHKKLKIYEYDDIFEEYLKFKLQ